VRAFAALFAELDETTRTGDKVAALARYFERAPPEDAAWAVHYLAGNRPKRLIAARRLAGWAMEATGTREWLFAECYEAAGDLAETITLLLPPPERASDLPLHRWIEERLLPLRGEDEAVQRREVLRAWGELDTREAFVWNKLITGGFRVGVSAGLVVRALAHASGVDAETLSHRLAGAWEPSGEAFRALVAPDTRDADPGRPYPFFLAHPLEGAPEALGDPGEWQVEWKWDGIRGQVIRREGITSVWSRGGERVAERFPEIGAAAALLPEGTVLDGEILAWKDGAPLPFARLQRRIGRRAPGPKILAEVPAAFLAFDLLEEAGRDVREVPLADRRARLEALLGAGVGGSLRAAPVIAAGGWEDAAAAHRRAREAGAEGLMLKRRDSAYGVGRRRGAWWKWKVAPYTVDAVLLYAQRGHGRRASLYTDYTFAVWRDGELVPFAKAYSGLTDAEIRRVDSFVRRNTVERFGPVRAVRPELVFELAFEGIQRSPRHRSGIAVRFPRMARWRTDKRPEEADTLDAVLALLEGPGAD
jgi:DNA ligase 1